MLGNFSFGDYFKQDAIDFAWELVTERFGLDPRLLAVTVFREDDEAYGIWEKGGPEVHVKKELYWPKGKDLRGVAGAADLAAARPE
jgi:alanyl-tRNA synthetase